MNEKKVIISILVLVAVFFLAFYFYLPRKSSDLVKETAENHLSTTTTPASANNSRGLTGSADVDFAPDTTVLDEEFLRTIPQPSINKEVIISTSMPDNAKRILINNISKTRSDILEDRYNLDLWVQLGVQYKVAGNMEAAKEVWEYVTKSNPKSLSAHSNLGDIYHYYFKDYIKAEYNLKKVIEIDQSYIIGYTNLSDLYRYSYKKDSPLASDTLKAGIAKNPDSIDLHIALATYLMEKGNRSDAIQYYEKALQIATKIGDSSKKMIIENIILELR